MKADAQLLLQQAQWAGQHALPLFFMTLALLLAATGACWWILQRYDLDRGQRIMSSRVAIGLRVAIGTAIILLSTGVFAELAGHLGVGGNLSRADQALTDALQTSVPQSMLQVFAILTHFGDTVTLTGLCLGILIALIVVDRRCLALGWVVAVAGNGLLNQTLKQIYGRIRPLHPDDLMLAQGFSFPSGHSSGTVVAYGMLAYLVLRLLPARWHLPTLVAMVVLAFTVGTSRLFLRVHFASDVIAGFASGAAWLALCIMSMELLRLRSQYQIEYAINVNRSQQ